MATVLCSPFFRSPQGVPTGLEPTTEPTSHGAWTAIAGSLRRSLSETIFDTWFAEAEPKSLDDGGLQVAFPNDFTRDWVESHFSALVCAAAREALGRDLQVSFVVAERAPAVDRPAARAGPAPAPSGCGRGPRSQRRAPLPRHDASSS